MDLNIGWPEADTSESPYEPPDSILPAATEASSAQERAQSLTRYQYFFVPSHQTDEDDAECITKPGAFLRLGAYSDIEEESAQTEGGLSAYYPSRYIARESEDNVFKNAAGSDAAQSCGIALTCDGRVMLKAEEEVFIEATDLVDIHSGKDINLTADTGPITAATGDNFSVSATKKVSLRSGANQNEPYVPPAENTSGDTGVEIIADNGNSDVFLEGKAIYLHAHGSQTTDIDGEQTTIVRSDTLDDIWGNKKSIFRGSHLSLYFAGGLSYRASASFNVSTSIDLNLLMTDFKFAIGTFELVKWAVNLKEMSVNNSVLDTQITQLSNRVCNLSTDTVFYEMDISSLSAKTSQIATEMGNMKASIMQQCNVQL
ncbi:hypothetical protein E1180_09200 [Roseibium denhamense]|uniref:Uncharacterized protein n=1 Tax=Roseibium denhamense TaxID=76305 RepID=A0ABY1NA97_9HYPH|nr:hypothetical protein [Roseibium denhamense]MTI05692.1 hypothetical protein [Roseibium denhamense]SMP04255.1 hypothetical protein SAMN06265374_0603 [Roseibium denhamense]